VAQRFLGLAPRGLGVPWQGFPHFLRHQGQGASFDYVADIAELECARAGARVAAAARPISAQALASMVSIRLDRLRVTLHPSVHLVTSRFPIVTIWNNNQRDGGGMIERWVGESALVARPFRAVEVGLLPAGGHAFMAALAEGQTVAAAVMVASAMAPTFDTDVGLAVLMSSHIVVGLCHDRQADPTIAITQCGTRV
jgi:hypothetical protein